MYGRIPVEPTLGDLPLLEYLAVLWPDRSKAGLRALFARGAVRVKGKPVSPREPAGNFPAIELQADPVDLPVIYLAENELESGVRLLHEDERIAVLDKPSGIPVVPDRSRERPSCLGYLIRRELQARPGKSPGEFRRLRVVHRIDRLTSGLVILARTPGAERELSRLFEAGKVRKEYLALLCGQMSPARISVHVPVGTGRKGKMRASAPGKPSLTVFEVLERFRGHTLVRALPRTGRMHQIRVHAWAMGRPLAIDPLYRVGSFARLPPPPVLDRLSLHAARLTLPPAWGDPREFTADVPADFQESLAALRATFP